jgi:hypothetical protein
LCCFSPLHLYLNISIAKVFLSSSSCAYFFAAVVIVLLNSFVLPIDRPVF